MAACGELTVHTYLCALERAEMSWQWSRPWFSNDSSQALRTRAENGGVVETGFSADEWSRLTPQERARRCKVMAVEANALARSSTKSEMAQMYYELAVQWERLAREIERTATSAS